MSNGSTTWNMTYDADGLRTKRTDGSNTYLYYYDGGLLRCMEYNGVKIFFTYDAQGMPVSMTYNGNTYYYALNLQGDVMAILNASSAAVVNYNYNAWGELLSTTGSLANTIGVINPSVTAATSTIGRLDCTTSNPDTITRRFVGLLMRTMWIC